MKNPKLLSDTQDKVFADPAYQPTIDPKTGKQTTHCNQATQAVLNAFGCHDLDNLMADQMFAVLKAASNWIEKPIGDCQFLTNAGTVVVAILPSWILKEEHGHIVTLTPGKEGYSGAWDKKVPVCMNIGGKTLCFRSKGVDYAFPVTDGMPRFFAWVPSL